MASSSSSILKMPSVIPSKFHSFSFYTATVPTPIPLPLPLHSQLSHLTLRSRPSTLIRMGGGPRTYPGGVSKWQWKRMQAKKAKQLLKARLARERQIYEMRKRAELKAAVSDLERPWEVVEQAPNLFSVAADEQLKVLADRFQKPGGFDMWSEKDGPQLFQAVDGLPSARFFPKGVVHSVKPYLRDGESCESNKLVSESSESRQSSNREGLSPESSVKRYGKKKNGVKWRSQQGSRRDDSAQVSFDRKQRGERVSDDGDHSGRKNLELEVCHMSLQRDGSYGFHGEMY